jgi:hypothetical protein
LICDAPAHASEAERGRAEIPGMVIDPGDDVALAARSRRSGTGPSTGALLRCGVAACTRRIDARW